MRSSCEHVGKHCKKVPHEIANIKLLSSAGSVLPHPAYSYITEMSGGRNRKDCGRGVVKGWSYYDSFGLRMAHVVMRVVKGWS